MVHPLRTTYKQREPFYKDIQALLTQGFLAHRVLLSHTNISLRNLGPNDFFLLQHRVPLGGMERDWKRWVVATCIWMVNGQITLGESNAPVVIHNVIRGIPEQTLEILYHVVLGLSRRKDEAIECIEPFCLEATSRSLWKQVGKGGFPRDSFSGVPGAEKLGANVIQRLWTVFNEFEDQKLIDIAAWSHAKFLVSPHAPKGVKSLDARDRQKLDTEEREHSRLLDRFFYAQLGLHGGDLKRLKEFDAIKIASTPEELEDEMRRWLAGDLDMHDRIVEGYKEKVRQRREADKAERRKRLEEARARAAEAGEDTEVMKLIGYAPEQVQAMLEKRRGGRPIGMQHVEEGNRQDYAYQKYIGRELADVPLEVVDGHIRQVTPNSNAINEQLAGRQVNGGLYEDGRVNAKQQRIWRARQERDKKREGN